MNLKKLINAYQVTVNDNRESGTIRSVYRSVLEDLKQLDELTLTTVSTKVEIPQCAIDVIENAKEEGHSLSKAMDIMGKTKDFCDWIDLPTNQELFARAWLDGYEETRYLVKMKNLNAVFCYLAYDKRNKYWSLASNGTDQVDILHTRKELEEAGFGEVFTSSLFEVLDFKKGELPLTKE